MSRAALFQSAIAAFKQDALESVGRVFVLERLYGGKYAPHIGTSSLPLVYLKVLLSATCVGDAGVQASQQQYLLGLLSMCLPSVTAEERHGKEDLLAYCWSMKVEGVEQQQQQQLARNESESKPSGNTNTNSNSSSSSTGAAGSSVDDDSLSNVTSSTFHGADARVLIFDCVSTCMAANESRAVALRKQQRGFHDLRMGGHAVASKYNSYSYLHQRKLSEIAERVAVSTSVKHRLEALVRKDMQLAAVKRRLLQVSLYPSQPAASARHRGREMETLRGDDQPLPSTAAELQREWELRPEEEVAGYLQRCQPQRQRLVQWLLRARQQQEEQQ